MFNHRATFEAIGTKWTIDAAGGSEDGWHNLVAELKDGIEEFDSRYSRFRDDSLVASMSRKAGSYPMPKDGYKLFKFYDELYRSTNGLVTPLIGQVVSDAGYDSNYSLKPKPLAQPPHWKEIIDYSKDRIIIRQPALLDFGAAGKGYLVDIIGDLMKNAGVSEFVINAGGDLLHYSGSGSSVSVGLENPATTAQAIGIIELGNMSLCGSSASRRQWGSFNHLINPTTLESPQEVLATWVIASDALTADGVATALFFCKPERLERFDFAYAILHKDMSLKRSKNFKAKIFEVAQ